MHYFQRVLYPIFIIGFGIVGAIVCFTHALDRGGIWWWLAVAGLLISAAGVWYLIYFRRYWTSREGQWY